MATTEELLKLGSRGAVVKIINDENDTLFDGSDAGPLVISEPLKLGDTRTEVEISIRRRLSGDDFLPFQGKLAFRYNRLDVENTLYGKLTGFRPPMPTSTQVLLDELSRRTGITFETENFILEDIIRSNAAPYVLKAKPESLRWVGSMEVQLIDLTELSSYIPGGLPVGQQQLEFTAPQTRTRDNMPYVNGTAFRKEIEALAVNSPITATSHPLYALIVKSLPPLGSYLRDSVSPWRVSTTAGTYNLRNAVLVNKAELINGLNPIAPLATIAARVRLGPLDTTFGDKDLLIPYAITNFNDSAFNDVPRLKATAVVNASNGTPWNKWLNGLAAPSIITSLPNGLNLRFSGPDLWVANANTPSPTNLYNAVVQYNGSRRAYDIRGYYPECNRVVVLTISDKNTAYQGNLTFHYRAPIMINEKVPDAELGTDFDFALAPSEGVAPYTITRVSGALATDHTLTADHRIAGPTTQVGNFQVVYDVKDAANTVVRYALGYRVVVGNLRVVNNPPAATRNQPFEFVFQIKGGMPAYTYRLINNSGGSELSLPSPFAPRVVGTFIGNAGTRSYALEVTDSQGSVATYSFTITVL